jgi:hypothetical protein
MSTNQTRKPRVLASTTGRGYGARHQAERKRWAPVVKAGRAVCTRCGLSIDPAEPFDLDHADDRSGYLGVAHRRCNRGELSRRRRALLDELPQPTRFSRVW